LPGGLFSHDIFPVEGFPAQRPDCIVIYCNGLFYLFPNATLSTFSLISPFSDPESNAVDTILSQTFNIA